MLEVKQWDVRILGDDNQLSAHHNTRQEATFITKPFVLGLPILSPFEVRI